MSLSGSMILFMKPFLSVIIPCYNERENVERGVLKEVEEWLKSSKFKIQNSKFNNSYEVIVSDDASTDNSRELVKEFVKKHSNFQLLENEHGGKAWALRHGLEASKGEWALFTDMDQSTPISELDKLMVKAQSGNEVVIGSRGKLRENFSLLRKTASSSFRIFRKSLMLRKIDDTQCGFKLIKREVARKIFEKMMIFEQSGEAKGWVVAAWDVEFLFLAEKYGYKIAEVPVKWSDKDETKGKDRSVMKFVKESLDMLKQLLRVKVNDSKGMYN